MGEQVSTPDVQSLKEALVEAGVEIYRVDANEIQIAERVRLHIMDSGVRVAVGDQPVVKFTARSQRSDFPNAEPEVLFARVRASVGEPAEQRGYVEEAASSVEVTDPVNDERVLDVWHEVTYAKKAPQLSEIIEEVRWALGVEKYVAH